MTPTNEDYETNRLKLEVEEKPKGMNLWMIRLISTIAAFILSLLISFFVFKGILWVGKIFDSGFVLSALWIVYIGGGIFFGALLFVVIAGWTTIPQGYVATRKIFQKYICTHGPGLDFYIKGIESYDLRSTKESGIGLFVDEEGKYDSKVDFVDGSSPVDSTAFLIIDPLCAYKANYAVEKVYDAVKKKMRDAVRGFLQPYTVDEANLVKARANLNQIMNGDWLEPKEKDENRRKTPSSIEELKETMRDCSLWARLYNDYGVMVTQVTIEDIDLPENIRKKRDLIVEKDKESQAAKFEAEKIVTLADARKKEMDKIGKGARMQIKDAISVGVNPDLAMREFTERIKWENVGDKTIIDSGSGGFAGLGVQFAAGQQMFKQSNKSGISNVSSDDDTDKSKKESK